MTAPGVQETAQAVAAFAADAKRLREAIGQVIVGNDEVVESAILCLLAGGHLLLEGVPGTGKTLLARALGSTTYRIVGSPEYLARHGTPTRAADLAGHVLVDFAYRRSIATWPAGLAARVHADDGEGVRHLALAGVGLVRLVDFALAADLRAGRLVAVLPALSLRVEAFHAVWVGGGPVPTRIRRVLDHLAAHGRVGAVAP